MKTQNSNICAIICEYNPMHTGHIYLIEKAKQLSNANYMVGLMSGNFSQRSLPCVLNKYIRSEIAVKNGLDLVLNFPTAFCTNSAEIFAMGAIKILNQFNITHLAFGVETLNEKAFYILATFLLKEDKNFKKNLKLNLKNGNSYSKSLILTIQNHLQFFDENLHEDIVNILTKPNNILALEYIKALIKLKSKIKPIFIKRVDNFNNDLIINNFASSSLIRKKIDEKNINEIEHFLPQNSLEHLTQINVNYSLLNNLILYNIKTQNLNYLKHIYGVCEGLENKLKHEAEKTNNYKTFVNNLISKRYPENKINTILLNSLLNINKKIIKKLYTIKSNIIIKILAINIKNNKVLTEIGTKNLIIRQSDMQKIKVDKYNKKLIEIENKANSIYNLISNCNLNEQDFYNKLRK